MIDFNVRLENDYILLRPMSQSDFDAFLPITSEPSLWQWYTSDLSDERELKNWVKQAIAQRNAKTRLAFTIIDKEGGEVIGSTSFGSFSARDQRLEIGWTWLAKKCHGKGFNQQVKRMMLRYCFEVLNISRVEVKTDVLNIPARKALVKAGFTEEGVLRSHTLMTHGRRRDTIYFSMLKEEWATHARDSEIFFMS